MQKALRRLAAEKAPTSLSQLVMWQVAAGLDWETIAQLSRELGQSPRADAGQGIRGHLDALPEGETGRILFEVEGKRCGEQSRWRPS